MKVLVTGSGGYIGRHVVKALLSRGIDVIAADIRNDGLESSDHLKVMNCSIFDKIDKPFEYFGEPDVCIHLAWRNGFVHNSDTHISDLSAHFDFMKSLIDGGLKKIACMGTMHEIGYFEGAIDENTPCRPLSQYGIAKNALRGAMINLCERSNVKLFWLRAYYIVGDDARNHSVFSKIIEMDAEGKETFPFTSGKNLYDFIDVDELARQIALASIQDKVTGIINVCTGKPVSLGDKVEEFIKEKGLRIRPQYGAFPDRNYDSPKVWGDPGRINDILRDAEEKQ